MVKVLGVPRIGEVKGSGGNGSGILKFSGGG